MKNEEWYVIFNMNCKYEICRMCPKSGLFKGSYEECEKWIKQKKKEEKKDKMKNRISLALKDPILQQGFEIICKENAELKEEMSAKQVVLNDFKSRFEIVTGRYNQKSSQLTEAKDLIRNLLRVTWGEGWNYSLDWKVKAEQFLKDLEK